MLSIEHLTYCRTPRLGIPENEALEAAVVDAEIRENALKEVLAREVARASTDDVFLSCANQSPSYVTVPFPSIGETHILCAGSTRRLRPWSRASCGKRTWR